MLVTVIAPVAADKPLFGSDLETRAATQGIGLWFVNRDSRDAATGTPGQPDRLYGKTGRWYSVKTIASRVQRAEGGEKIPYWWKAVYDGRRDDERSKYANGGVELVKSVRAARKARTPVAAPVAAPEVTAPVAAPVEVAKAAAPVGVISKWTDGLCGTCGKYALIVRGADECRECLLATF